MRGFWFELSRVSAGWSLKEGQLLPKNYLKLRDEVAIFAPDGDIRMMGRERQAI